MVLLAAAVCSKNGKALVSRQFVEMSRSRVEGLLAAFPKLMNTGQQHTFVETESVRYVYQPLDKLFVLLITTKASNILEDLETLRLFSRVVPEYCKVLEDNDILDNAFQLIFAFDEIVALGYRENVNLAQIRTFIEMDSHEERVINAVRKTQELEAKEQMKRKAKELQAARQGAKAKNLISGIAGGISSQLPSRGGYTNNDPVKPQLEVGDTASTEPAPSKPAPKISSGKALRLGSKNKDVDTFVDKLISEGTNVSQDASKPARTQQNKAITPSTPSESVHIKREEKMWLTVSRHGGLQNLEVRGIVQLKVTDAENAKLAILLDNSDQMGFQLQTHPNVDKKLFQQNNVIGLKQGGKGFPLNAEIGVLKWRLQTKDEEMIPLTINCWPNENEGDCEVTIEFELQNKNLELSDVTISIPIPSGVGAPVVGEVSGEYHYDTRKSMLDWSIPVIDGENDSGSIEFSIAGQPDDFFPINASFSSSKTLCDITIKEVQSQENQAAVKYSQDQSLVVEKYEVV